METQIRLLCAWATRFIRRVFQSFVFPDKKQTHTDLNRLDKTCVLQSFKEHTHIKSIWSGELTFLIRTTLQPTNPQHCPRVDSDGDVFAAKKGSMFCGCWTQCVNVGGDVDVITDSILHKAPIYESPLLE